MKNKLVGLMLLGMAFGVHAATVEEGQGKEKENEAVETVQPTPPAQSQPQAQTVKNVATSNKSENCHIDFSGTVSKNAKPVNYEYKVIRQNKNTGKKEVVADGTADAMTGQPLFFSKGVKVLI